MKVHFHKVDIVPYSELEIYNSENRIPFTFSLINDLILPETIYACNVYEQNFIEFRFNANSHQLYEITLVNIQKDTVEFTDKSILSGYESNTDQLFKCFIDETSKLKFSIPIKVLYNNTDLSISWGSKNIKFYPISKKCTIGVNSNDIICSVNLTNLKSDSILTILGLP